MPPLPLILDDASLQISSDDTFANLKELACTTTHLELTPDTTITTVDTFCGSTDYPGVTKWTLTATLVQSFDAGSTDEVLTAAIGFGKPVAFAVMGYRTQPPSALNPVWSGLCNPRHYAPINGDAGAASEVSIEWGVVGAPTKGIVMPTSASSAVAYEPTPAAGE